MGGEKEKLSIRGGPGRCPYCHDLIADTREVVACASCGARHHQRCHAEHGACCSCGSTDALVPRSQAREAAERPPRGSSIKVIPAGQSTSYAWENSSPQQLLLILLLVACFVVTIPLIPFVFLYWLQARRRETSVQLHEKGLALDIRGPFVAHREVRAARKDVGAVRLTRIQQQGLRLTIDVGVDRITIATAGPMTALKEPEVEWLYERLLSWKEQG